MLPETSETVTFPGGTHGITAGSTAVTDVAVASCTVAGAPATSSEFAATPGVKLTPLTVMVAPGVNSAGEMPVTDTVAVAVNVRLNAVP
jgi:hypothetical protein